MTVTITPWRIIALVVLVFVFSFASGFARAWFADRSTHTCHVTTQTGTTVVVVVRGGTCKVVP